MAWTTNQALSLTDDQIMNMNEKQLREVLARLRKTSNARIKELQQKAPYSPALAYIEQSGGKISSAGKSVIGLRNEIQRATGFLQMKTSSVTGARAVRTELLEAQGKWEMTEKQEEKFWAAYRRIEEGKEGIFKSDFFSSGEFRKNLRRVFSRNPRIGLERLTDIGQQLFDEMYEKGQQYDISEFTPVYPR